MRITTTYGPGGVDLIRTVDDNGDGTATVTEYPSGATTVYAMAAPDQQPLDNAGALAALLACTGVLDVQDAANSVHVSAEALVSEVLAWEAAQH